MKINNRPVNKEKEKINQEETALLQYIVIGIVPLLSTFCTEYKELRESYGNQFKELKPQNVAILTRLENEVVVSLTVLVHSYRKDNDNNSVDWYTKGQFSNTYLP